MHGVAAYYKGQKQGIPGYDRVPCSKCGVFHGVPPFEHFRADQVDEDCGHDPDFPCKRCGGPVGLLSTGGSEVCCRCACGMSESDGMPADDHCDCTGGYGYGCIKCSLPPDEKLPCPGKQPDPAEFLRKELDASTEYHEHCTDLIEEALRGDGLEGADLNVSLFEGYALRIKALMKTNAMTEKILSYLENQVASGKLGPDRKLLEQIHVALQGDLSYDKVGAAKKIIEDVLGGSPCEPLSIQKF